ncbi:MAG: heme exporter protein CcmB [Deltaproteobacteria bacterium]|nr:heme exporter protein CcmB [Deltaproteobacteria bacterium]
MTTLRAVLMVLLKDLRIEIRTGEIVVTTALFALLVTVLTSLSFYLDQNTALLVAPGILWVAIAFSGVLIMGRSWSREKEYGVIRALWMAPIPRSAIFLGKAMSALGYLAVVEIAVVFVVGVLFQLDMMSMLGSLTTLLALGSIGFIAAGNLFAAMGVRSRTRDLILAVAVFPLIAPSLVCAVIATRELFHGAPIEEIFVWIRILIAFDVIFVTIGLWLFEPLMSD